MAAPRATQFIALRNLARHGNHPQVRHLHMTEPASSASPILTRARSPVINAPNDVASLRAECKRRKIDAGGSKQDLLSRLQIDETAGSRAFSSVVDFPTRRPTIESNSLADKVPTRHFNTSRALKAVNDTSTIDFAYLPSSDSIISAADPHASVRVPILPSALSKYTVPSTPASAAEDDPVMLPTISTMSADKIFTISPMAEVSDGHAIEVDFHAVADTVAARLDKLKDPVEKQVGAVGQILGDMMEDVLGFGRKRRSAAK